LFRSDGHDLLGNHIEGEEVKVLEQDLVLACIALGDVVENDFLLLGIGFEVLLEFEVRQQLFFEFDSLLQLDSLIV
jgi:hypothetical protein